jgi:O6-methylguanine-DNA--protein-cysteine methyltransferase
MRWRCAVRALLAVQQGVPRAVEDTITRNAVDLVAQCDRVIAAKGGLLSEVR